MGPAPAPSAAHVEIDDLVLALTVSDMERRATARAARAFNEFWNSGDEALLKRVFDENFTNYRPASRWTDD
jgi:hypothetical protein